MINRLFILIILNLLKLINKYVKSLIFTWTINDDDKSFVNKCDDDGGVFNSFDVDSHEALWRNNNRLFFVLFRFHPSWNKICHI